ncbi:MAG: nucleotidyltransferase domain-containing protein [candidate division KSB1 bacterium]|nr:nucleotidyltransferase domain-containing protein [candidate division KSB1 bacterium]
MSRYDQYISYWKNRLECAQFLGTQYGVQRVFLIGSLAREGFAHARSDIDLVVEGLASNQYFSALSAVWKKLPPGVELDLIPLEDAYESLKERVFQEGKLLYERK